MTPPKFLTAADLDRLLTPDDLLAAAERSFIAISNGTARQPERTLLRVQNGGFGLMPGEITDPPVFGIKLVSLFPNAAAQGLSSHQGMVIVFDGRTGEPRLIIDGARLTAMRTAAASVVSARVLANAPIRTLGLIGCGEQSAEHLRLFRHAFPLERIIVWGRRREAAQAFANQHGAVDVANTVEDTCQTADVICTLTKAKDPILFGRWLRPGQHLIAAGSSTPDKREIDEEAVARSSVFVDWRQGAEREAGDIKAAIAAKLCDQDVVRGEVGEVLFGKISGRRSANEITLFKSLGVAAEDLTLAHVLVERA